MEATTANLRGRPPLDRPLQRYTLTVLSGPSMGTTLPLTQPRTVVGRSRSADLTIDEGHVSRYHFEIELLPADQGLIVRDLRSKNGTFVRNCRIIEALIEEQGYIELGEGTLLEVSLPYVQVTGYSRHGLGVLVDPRLRASAALRPTSPAASERPPLVGLPSPVRAEEVPTGTLVIRREELRALVERKAPKGS